MVVISQHATESLAALDLTGCATDCVASLNHPVLEPPGDFAPNENAKGRRLWRIAAPSPRKKIIRSSHSSLTDRMNRSRFGFKFGDWGGNRTALRPVCSMISRN